jgi:hypothetical protein
VLDRRRRERVGHRLVPEQQPVVHRREQQVERDLHVEAGPEFALGDAAPDQLLGGLAVAAVLAVAMALSPGGDDSAAKLKADQEAAAHVSEQGLHDLGTRDYRDLCDLMKPGSLLVAKGVDQCVILFSESSTSAGDDQTLAVLATLTVDPGHVRVTGDDAVVPVSAVLRDGVPLPPSAGLKDETLVRIKGQWYIMPD